MESTRSRADSQEVIVTLGVLRRPRFDFAVRRTKSQGPEQPSSFLGKVETFLPDRAAN